MADRIAERHIVVGDAPDPDYCEACSELWPCDAITEHRRAEQYRAHADALADALDRRHGYRCNAPKGPCDACTALAAIEATLRDPKEAA